MFNALFPKNEIRSIFRACSKPNTRYIYFKFDYCTMIEKNGTLLLYQYTVVLYTTRTVRR